MSLPSTYKRAVFNEAGGPLSVEQTEMTMPAAGEVLVKVEACGVCHSDTIPQVRQYTASSMCWFSILTSSALLFPAMRSLDVSLRSVIQSPNGRSAIALGGPGMEGTMVNIISWLVISTMANYYHLQAHAMRVVRAISRCVDWV